MNDIAYRLDEMITLRKIPGMASDADNAFKFSGLANIGILLCISAQNMLYGFSLFSRSTHGGEAQ